MWLEHILFITESCIRKNFLQILPLLFVFYFVSLILLVSPRCLMHFSSSALAGLCLSLSLSPKVLLCVGEFPGIWGSHRGFSWENSSSGNCSQSKPGALSCISMRDQDHPPQSSVEIPGAGSMRRKTAGKKQNLTQVGPFLLRSPRKAEKTFRMGFFSVSAVAVLGSP